jgi:hypothetical protein
MRWKLEANRSVAVIGRVVDASWASATPAKLASSAITALRLIPLSVAAAVGFIVPPVRFSTAGI